MIFNYLIQFGVWSVAVILAYWISQVVIGWIQ